MHKTANNLLARHIHSAIFGLTIGLALGAASGAHGEQIRNSDPWPRGVAITGYVVAHVRTGAGLVEIDLADVTVSASLEGSVVQGNEVRTNGHGKFITPRLAPGVYRVCTKAVGFSASCLRVEVRDGSAIIPLSHRIVLQPAGNFLWGRATMQDGTPAARLAVAAYMSSAVGQVSLETAAGELLAGPAPVDSGGHYVLPNVPVSGEAILKLRYEGAERRVPVQLADTAGRDRKPLDIALDSAHPKITSIEVLLDGQPVKRAPPGSFVTVVAKVEDNSGGNLRYAWGEDAQGNPRPDQPSIQFAVPGPGTVGALNLEVRNGRGGVDRASIAVSSGPVQPGAATIFFAAALAAQLAPDAPNPGTFIDVLGCDVEEAKCKALADEYYKAVGVFDSNNNPTGTRGDFDKWKTTNGFGQGHAEISAIYFNNADLHFGRSMHCRDNSDKNFVHISCYVSNFSDNGSDPSDNPEESIKKAIVGTEVIASVAMEYWWPAPGKTAVSAPGGLPLGVSFYVYKGDTGAPLKAAALDSQKDKYVPGLCMACHGGSGPPENGRIQDAKFLPFDAPILIFSSSNATYGEVKQREAIRKLNRLVRITRAAQPGTDPITDLIDGWYHWCGTHKTKGVNTPGCYIDDKGHPFIPSANCSTKTDKRAIETCGWKGEVKLFGALKLDLAKFYQEVPRMYCRTCHVARNGNLNVQSFADFDSRSGAGRGQVAPRVLGNDATHQPNKKTLLKQPMPFAEVTFNALWAADNEQSAQARKDFKEYLCFSDPFGAYGCPDLARLSQRVCFEGNLLCVQPLLPQQ